MSEPSCAAVILAAGASRRLGQAKQLVKIDGEPLLGRTVRLAAQAGCQPVVMVLGFEAHRMRSALEGFRVIVAVNENWDTGMGSSMRCGVETALRTSPPPEDILLMVCDQVRLTAEVLRRVLDLHGSRKYPITAACYGGRLGVPAVFSSIFFPDLLDVSGDRGARGILERNAERVGGVDFLEGELDWTRRMISKAALRSAPRWESLPGEARGARCGSASHRTRGRRLMEGISLPEKLQLKLVESKTFKSGCVALRYLKQ
jgi:molybdenum cofactor cytidylyltransferase